jgi:Protein of unknown function (DUF1579)
MKLGFAVCGAFIVGASLALVAATPWQDAKAKDGAGMPSADDMAAMMKFGTPGPMHADLAKQVGKWTVTGEWIMDPAAPPTKTSGTAEFKMILGGRYIMQELSSTSSWGPFNGVGVTGYNNGTGKFEDVWMDDMSTAIFNCTGEMKGDVASFAGDMYDPITKSMSKMRYDIKHSGADEFTMDMYCTSAGKPEFKCMTLNYKRAAAGAR